MVNSLATQYKNRGKDVLFLEHDIDDRSDVRASLWWKASGKTGSQTTPFVIVDSGYKYTNGSENFETAYSKLVDDALRRPPEAEITAAYERVKDQFTVRATVKNLTREPIGYDNDARLYVLLYEDTQVIHVDRFVRAGMREFIVEDIQPGDTATFDLTLDVPATSRANYAKSHVLVILDELPAGSRGYAAMQAAIAEEGFPEPTPEPTATEEPTPTDVPTATPTEEPTIVLPSATPVPTEEPTFAPLYLPSVMRE